MNYEPENVFQPETSCLHSVAFRFMSGMHLIASAEDLFSAATRGMISTGH